MIYPEGFDRVFDLQTAISKYCELSPDPYARLNYDHVVSELEDPWQTVDASWAWLHKRLLQDRSELVSIGDCQHGLWWEDWGFVDYC